MLHNSTFPIPFTEVAQLMMWLKISLLTFSYNGTPEGTEQQYPIACSLYLQAATSRAAVMIADSVQVIRFSWHDTVE